MCVQVNFNLQANFSISTGENRKDLDDADLKQMLAAAIPAAVKAEAPEPSSVSKAGVGEPLDCKDLQASSTKANPRPIATPARAPPAPCALSAPPKASPTKVEEPAEKKAPTRQDNNHLYLYVFL